MVPLIMRIIMFAYIYSIFLSVIMQVHVSHVNSVIPYLFNGWRHSLMHLRSVVIENSLLVAK